jgi:hypothetical protein
MKILSVIGVILVIGLVFSGCATFQRSEVIETDKLGGYASGTYRENSQGPSGTFSLLGAGGGGGAGGIGMGGLGFGVSTGPIPSGNYNFAKSIAMINYSKKLQRVTYDEYGGVIDYEFAQMPMPSMKTTYEGSGTKSKLPSSFGHQPIE